jgi:O-antigen ligase
MTSATLGPRPPEPSLWLAAALLGAAWLLPIHDLPWLAFHADLLAAAALALMAVACLRQAQGRVHVPSLARQVLAVACVPLLQAAFGLTLFAGDALMAALYLLGLAIAIVGGAGLARGQPHSGLLLCWALLVAGLLSTLMATLQWLQWSPGPLLQSWLRTVAAGERPTANIGQSNMLATLLVLAVVAALALHQAKRIGHPSGVACGGVLIAGVVITQSRTGLLALGVVALWLGLSSRRSGPAIGWKTGAGAALWLLLCLLLRSWLSQPLRITPLRPTLDAAVGPRAGHWSTLWEAIQATPWFGQGWNQVAVAQARAAGQSASGEFIEHSHNLVLDLLVWNGVPLGLLILALILVWTFRQLRDCRDPQQALMLAGVLALGVHAMTEYPLDYAYFLMPLGAVLGALDANRDAQKRPGLQGQGLARSVCMAVLALAATLTAWVTVEYTSLEQDHALMRLQWARPDLVSMGTAAVPQVVLLTQLRALLVFMRTPTEAGLSAAQLQSMKRLSQRYGYAPVLHRMALTEHHNGRPEDARATLAHLCKTQSGVVCANYTRHFETATASTRPP